MTGKLDLAKAWLSGYLEDRNWIKRDQVLRAAMNRHAAEHVLAAARELDVEMLFLQDPDKDKERYVRHWRLFDVSNFWA